MQSQPLVKTICVYCGSADNLHPKYLQAAFQMGRALAQAQLQLVYGAGKTGLMGAVAEGVLQSGGEVVGVICENLNTPTLIHANLSQLEVVPDIHQRKRRMSELADAFIALPGGFGTLDELFETLTWAQIGIHRKPVGLLNTRGYFDPLLSLIEHAQAEGFIFPEHRQLLTHAAEPEKLLSILMDFKHPAGLDRWLTRAEPTQVE